MPTSEPIKLQKTAPNSCSQRHWLISVGHRTKGIVMNVGERVVGHRVGVASVVRRWWVRVACTYMGVTA